jgi:hypothetical protein
MEARRLRPGFVNSTSPSLSVTWGDAERGRECRWAADGDWVFVLSVNVTPRGSIRETEFRLARSQY